MHTFSLNAKVAPSDGLTGSASKTLPAPVGTQPVAENVMSDSIGANPYQQADLRQAANLNASKEEGTLTSPISELESWQNQLQDKVIIDLCHGARPSLEALRIWMEQTWANMNIIVNQVQYLPNGYYLFLIQPYRLWVRVNGG